MSGPHVFTSPGVWVASTPLHVAAGGSEPHRQTRPLEAWTVVSALELGIGPISAPDPFPAPDLLRPVVAEQGVRRSRLENRRVRQRPNGAPNRPPPTDGQPRRSQRKPPPSRPYPPQSDSLNTDPLRPDAPYLLLAAYIRPFSDHGLCLRWTRFDSYTACTLLFQKTRFDPASAQAAAEQMPEQIEKLVDPILTAANIPFVQLSEDPVEALLPGPMGWVGEFAIRSIWQGGWCCRGCDRTLGHCPQDIETLLQLIHELDRPLSLDLLLSPGYNFGRVTQQSPSVGCQLQLRLIAPERPPLSFIQQFSRRLVASAFHGEPLLRQHSLGPGQRARTEAAAAGAPLGPALARLTSSPLHDFRLANCLPWPSRHP